MKIEDVRKVAIVGVGLMGGSLAVALKKEFPNLSIWGYARSEKSYRKLCKLNILDRVERNLANLIKDADLIVLALPVESIIDYFKKISPLLKKNAVVFDLGSSKEMIERSASKYLPKSNGFVGCHPLCGGEKSGAQFYCADLYKGAVCLVTSSRKSAATRSIKKLWEELGSKVEFISAKKHDKILSSVSHLPHIISFSLTHSVPVEYLKFCSRSFKDLTRISNSPPSVWVDIFLSNKKNILKDIDGFIKVLKKFKVVVKEGDQRKITNLIKKVNEKQQLISL
jgi:prephenate dehydrogenase